MTIGLETPDLVKIGTNISDTLSKTICTVMRRITTFRSTTDRI